MTTDPALQSLFAASERTYEDDTFTQQVMKKSRFVRYRGRILLGAILLLMISAVTFASNDVQSLIIQLNNVMSADIFDLEEGMASVIMQPINTIAGVLFIIAKLVHSFLKWLKKR